ncbi:SCO2524 family protein [Streptomyces cylindrosporus]|uniref:SCO2524 family protein n=1 Tax=Streptomyces cylindrosporus TaxID=2927583 RepID=A0ABS9XXW1_9ACTN|nr:SCO2524 family protein [Streptomyces cylindrosporus]MCI3269790.1 SCO2524 family protein [Streptomyces cylindrosporus]
MEIKPRAHLLQIWEAIARHSFEDGRWGWGDWGGQSSVADAERLLCLMYPATEIPEFRLDEPDTTQKDVQRALRQVGGRTEIPAALVAALTEFMHQHTAPDGSPSFAGGYYFTAEDPDAEITPEQRDLGVVDSFSMSVTLCLATLGFIDKYQGTTVRSDVREAVEQLKQATSERLTAAMVGLLRSFTVNVFDADTTQGRRLARTLGQRRLSERAVLQQFQESFAALRATIADRITLGVDVADGLQDPSMMFECGWAWGMVRDAPVIRPTDRDGIADPVPYLYFTVVALDGIQDLSSDRTLALGLLTEEQQTLAEALRLRWTVTREYWSGIARFGADRWPLEDIPWRVTNQKLESEYFSLSVASLVVHDLIRSRAGDEELARTAEVLWRLAERGRINSPLTRDDRSLELHSPGVVLPLEGSESLGPQLRWTVTDFSAHLLKRTVQLAAFSGNIATQNRLLELAEDTFEHLWQRRIEDGEGADLWDDVQAVFPVAPKREGPLSWSMTERLTECMVAAYNFYAREPVRSPQLGTYATALISEATHRFGKEQMTSVVATDSDLAKSLRTIEIRLRRARELVRRQPGTASALAMSVLVELDTLAQARGAAAGEVRR